MANGHTRARPKRKDSPKQGTPKPSSYYIQHAQLPQVTAGCIVWLPSKTDILPGAHVDLNLHANAFDHPAAILSVPSPLKHDSVVQIAVMTSCGNRTLHQTKQLSHRKQLLRCRTKAYPFAKVDLTFKRGGGMERKYSYVSLRAYGVEVGTLGLYERGLGLCLTGASLVRLLAGVEAGRGKGVVSGKGGNVCGGKKSAGSTGVGKGKAKGKAKAKGGNLKSKK